MFSDHSHAGGSRLPIVRVRSAGETEVVLLGDRFFSLTTHWLSEGRGCSVLCPGDDCMLCELLPGRGVYYLPVHWDARVSILELGALSSSLLEQHCKLLYRGMRAGLVVRLCRRGDKQPVRSEVVDERNNTKAVDFATFVSRVLALYHFPCKNPSEKLEEYELRVRKIAKLRSDQQAGVLRSRSCGGC